MIYLSSLVSPHPKIYLLLRAVLHIVEVSKKFGDVALQAVGRCNIWMGLLTSMNCAISSRHIRVILVAAAEGGVVRIQAFGES